LRSFGNELVFLGQMLQHGRMKSMSSGSAEAHYRASRIQPAGLHWASEALDQLAAD
jgi:hypothetical protein